MPKIQYKTLNFRAATKDLIAKAQTILEEYSRQGYVLTLRQLYYQFVSRAFLANTERNYKKLGSAMADARLAGLIDWRHLEDRTRNFAELSHWNSVADIVRACANQFHTDWWKYHPAHVEVWVEKEALADVVAQAVRPYDVGYFCCRGYVSISEMWSAAMRWRNKMDAKRGPYVLLHLGDHDPSGIDMTRAIRDTLATFGVKPRVRRIALNMDQVEEYNPPPNPAKVTDSRYESYREEYGEESWELDALEPKVLHELIQKEIKDLIDVDETKFVLSQRLTQEGREQLSKYADQCEEEDDASTD